MQKSYQKYKCWNGFAGFTKDGISVSLCISCPELEDAQKECKKSGFVVTFKPCVFHYQNAINARLGEKD